MKRLAGHDPAAADRGGDVRVGVYVRRSTDDDHQPYSIEAQDARLAAYIGSQPGWRHHREDVIGSGTHSQRKALIEALVAQIKITGPGRIVPVFRIPLPDGQPDPVRAMTNLVGPVGFEPTLAGS